MIGSAGCRLTAVARLLVVTPRTGVVLLVLVLLVLVLLALGVVNVEPVLAAGAAAPPVEEPACAEEAQTASAIRASARFGNIRVKEVIRRCPVEGPR